MQVGLSISRFLCKFFFDSVHSRTQRSAPQMIDLFLVLYGHCGDVFQADRELSLDLTYRIASFSLSQPAAQAFGEAEKFILNKLAHIGFLFSCAKIRMDNLAHSQCPLTRKLAKNVKKYLTDTYTCKIIEWEKIGYTDLLAVYRDFEPFEPVLQQVLCCEVCLGKKAVPRAELADFFHAAYCGLEELAIELLVQSLEQLEVPLFTLLLSKEEMQSFSLCLERCKRISSRELCKSQLTLHLQEKHSILSFLEQLSGSLDRLIWKVEIEPKCTQITKILTQFYFALDSAALEEHFLCSLGTLSNIRKQNLNSCDEFSSTVVLNGDWDNMQFCRSSMLFRTEFPKVSCCLLDNLPASWNARLERIFHLVMAVKRALFTRKNQKSLENSLCFRFLVLLLEYIQTDVLLPQYEKFIHNLHQSVAKVTKFEARFEAMLQEIELGLFIEQDFVQQRFLKLVTALDAKELLEQVKFLVQAMQEPRISRHDIWIAKFLNRVNFNEYFSSCTE